MLTIEKITENLESLELPIYNSDADDYIEMLIYYYDSMGRTEAGRRRLRSRINELIDEYNDRRGMKVFNQVK